MNVELLQRIRGCQKAGDMPRLKQTLVETAPFIDAECLGLEGIGHETHHGRAVWQQSPIPPTALFRFDQSRVVRRPAIQSAKVRNDTDEVVNTLFCCSRETRERDCTAA